MKVDYHDNVDKVCYKSEGIYRNYKKFNTSTWYKYMFAVIVV